MASETEKRPIQLTLLDAAAVGNVENIRSALKENPQLLDEVRTEHNDSLLHVAASHGQVKAVEFLVKEKHFDVESKGYLGCTALIQSAQQGQLNVVKFLVEQAGADICAKATTEDQPMAVHLAAHFGRVEVLAYFLKRQPDLLEHARDNQNDTVIHVAASKGALKVVEFLVKEKKANVETKGYNGRTPLLEAAEKGQLAVVKFLVEQARADVFAKDSEDQEMAVHLAAYHGHLEVVAYLLDKKPELLESRDAFNDTCFHRAAAGGRLKVVEFLIKEKKANVENAGEFGRSPLLQAAAEGRLQVVQYLIDQAGAKITARDSSEDEDTAIHLAALGGHVEVVAFLVSRDASLVEVGNKTGLTALAYATHHDKLEVVKFLQSCGAKHEAEL